MSGRIVVGVDGSPEATAALDWAFEEAWLRHADVEVIHAWEFPYTGELPGLAVDRVAKETAIQAEELLRSVVGPAVERHPEIRVTTSATEGRPASVLTEAAAGADLLVVGSRGRGGFAGLLLGSVSQQCVHHAPCPVVVVRPAP